MAMIDDRTFPLGGEDTLEAFKMYKFFNFLSGEHQLETQLSSPKVNKTEQVRTSIIGARLSLP
jgi:hypothetical protein